MTNNINTHTQTVYFTGHDAIPKSANGLSIPEQLSLVVGKKMGGLKADLCLQTLSQTDTCRVVQTKPIARLVSYVQIPLCGPDMQTLSPVGSGCRVVSKFHHTDARTLSATRPDPTRPGPRTVGHSPYTSR